MDLTTRMVEEGIVVGIEAHRMNWQDAKRDHQKEPVKGDEHEGTRDQGLCLFLDPQSHNQR